MSEYYKEKIVREYPYLDQNTGEEIVRCKNCKNQTMDIVNTRWCCELNRFVYSNDYCKWGERA